MAFDASYFSQALPEQLKDLNGVPVVRVILHDGRELLVKSVRQALPGYVTLEIYPPSGEARGDFEFPPATSLIELPAYPTALAYEAIAQVFLQAAPGEQAGRLGYQVGAGA